MHTNVKTIGAENVSFIIGFFSNIIPAVPQSVSHQQEFINPARVTRITTIVPIAETVSLVLVR